MKAIAYNTIKENARAYEILQLRDQHDNKFTDIAKEYLISVSRAVEIYNRIKLKQIKIYINHIAITFGHENDSQIREVYKAAYECYQSRSFACAYMEKKYKEILTEYRGGEPGMPAEFIRNFPPFKAKLNKKEISRIIEMRDDEKLSFITIGKELKITQEKAKHAYNVFYHEKVLNLIEKLQRKEKSEKEKRDIGMYYFREFNTPKKRYDALMKK